MNIECEEQYRGIEIKLEIRPSFSHSLCIIVDKDAIIYNGIHSETIPISPSYFNNLIEKLNAIAIIAIPISKFILSVNDGTCYILSIKNGLYHAKFSWWQRSPPEWSIIGNFTDKLLDYVNANLKNERIIIK